MSAGVKDFMQKEAQKYPLLKKKSTNSFSYNTNSRELMHT